jgi:WD40 repeat protein
MQSGVCGFSSFQLHMWLQLLQGGVNDLALTRLDTQLIAVSGGSDATVKVWSAATSELLFCFAGEALHLTCYLTSQENPSERPGAVSCCDGAVWSICRPRGSCSLGVPARER